MVVGNTVRQSPPFPRRLLDGLVLVTLTGGRHGHLERVRARRHHPDAAHAGQGRGEADRRKTELSGSHTFQMSFGL